MIKRWTSKNFLSTVRKTARPPRGRGSSPLLLSMENTSFKKFASLDLSE